MTLEFRQISLGILALLGIGISIFSEHYRGVLTNMVAITTALLVPIFFIILALIFFTGEKVFAFPGVKTAVMILVVIMVIGGVSATLGNDVVNQLSGNSVRATDSLFKTDFLNSALMLVLGLAFFFTVLVKK